MVENYYVCPNHPDVKKENPGECPTCGMLLQDRKGNVIGLKIHKKGRKFKESSILSKQQPLVVILTIVFLTTFLFSARDYARGTLIETKVLSSLLGSAMLVFGSLKMFDVKGFAQGFSKYDLIAQRYEIYGFLYPFLQVVLALAFLLDLALVSVGFTTFLLFSISTTGILAKLMKGENEVDVGLGTYIPVPLSYFSLIESLGISVMACVILVHLWL
ncbi:hypothetical protein IPM62_01315 [Candidatus Woesebacteria bacterium]|nr:MAG: hypothetical protein IPM62_01315 [Candidatus Woesebacteria bacterium]